MVPSFPWLLFLCFAHYCGYHGLTSFLLVYVNVTPILPNAASSGIQGAFRFRQLWIPVHSVWSPTSARDHLDRILSKAFSTYRLILVRYHLLNFPPRALRGSAISTFGVLRQSICKICVPNDLLPWTVSACHGLVRRLRSQEPDVSCSSWTELVSKVSFSSSPGPCAFRLPSRSVIVPVTAIRRPHRIPAHLPGFLPRGLLGSPTSKCGIRKSSASAIDLQDLRVD